MGEALKTEGRRVLVSIPWEKDETETDENSNRALVRVITRAGLMGVDAVSKPEGECKGKAAARALAVLILTEETYLYLERCDPKALEQAKKALEPFGYPDLDALRAKLGL